MVVVERLIQTVAMDKFSELDELDKKWDVVESRLGFPSKKRYQALAGSYDVNTVIVERRWNSMAEMEATLEKANQDPDYLALFPLTTPIVLTNRMEIYSELS